jgi:hypothetical protein
MLPALFCFSYFSDKVSQFCPAPASNCDPSTYASCIAGNTDVHHHIQLIFWDRVSLALNHDPPDLYLLSRWNCRHATALSRSDFPRQHHVFLILILSFFLSHFYLIHAYSSTSYWLNFWSIKADFSLPLIPSLLKLSLAGLCWPGTPLVLLPCWHFLSLA